ncbi:YkgJ family cysteine cluster protein [Vibrio algarum]|uniref:YkgJ family cysteine cluster protein n=1 Tax=Vibrio algarum TaxID=3020714 RepID=A0ABT4YYV8_9VIBR|nr:YkgJ family cysteine cluster protein [Vibrio sp. KJ40-1]MDB1126133.1 YkgJ family cysteine cluster protein [Vibrio sp. KJ40-1]
MTKNIDIEFVVDPTISCLDCKACCCRLEVMILTDTGVPEEHIKVDRWGAETMRQLDDGKCSALNRETMMCTIYENRPWVCREFEMGSFECQDERTEGGIS